MQRKNEFENSLNLTKFALLMSGINIYPKKRNYLTERIVNYWLFYINLIGLYSVIVGEIFWLIDGVKVNKSFVELSLIVPCVTLSILGTLKSSSLYYNRQTVIKIIDELRKIHPDVSNDDTREVNEDDSAEKAEDIIESGIVRDSIKFLNKVIFLLTVISVVVMVMFCFSPLMSMGYDYYQTGESNIRYPYNVHYYFDVYTKIWPLEYLHHVWATCIVCINMSASETMFYVSCTYIEMHFRIMCHRLERIVSRSLKETKENLAITIRTHLVLMNLVDQTEKIYSNVMLFHIVSSSFLICLSGFNITVAEDIGKVSAYVTFLLMSLAQIYCFCLFGDKLMRSSTEVSAAIYNCAWHDVDLDTKKIILFITIRAQKPCKLTAANFVDLNLRAFTTMLSRSWSYFALLKTIYR